MSSFKLDVADLAWIAGAKDDPQDYCLHGRATAIIGSRALTYDCTVSAAALYLLKTLTEDHILGEDNQLFPCCGHFLVANDGLTNVTIIGCDSGVDWSVFHEEQHVRLSWRTALRNWSLWNTTAKRYFASLIRSRPITAPVLQKHSLRMHLSGTDTWHFGMSGAAAERMVSPHSSPYHIHRIDGAEPKKTGIERKEISYEHYS